MGIKVSESVLGVKEWECEVISNKNVATFIKEFIVALPPGEHMDFVPGSYAQIKIPKFVMDYDKDIDKSLIGKEYLPAWEKFGLFGLKCTNGEGNGEGILYGQLSGRGRPHHADRPHCHSPHEAEASDRLHGRDARHSFVLHLHAEAGRQGDDERPYGDFHPLFDSNREMMWIGEVRAWLRCGRRLCT